MDRSKLTDSQLKLRSNVRNAYMVATRAELERALEHHKDEFTRDCIRELIAELD